MIAEYTETISIRIPATIKHELERIAKETNKSFSDVARAALEKLAREEG